MEDDIELHRGTVEGDNWRTTTYGEILRDRYRNTLPNDEGKMVTLAISTGAAIMHVRMTPLEAKLLSEQLQAARQACLDYNPD